MPRRLKPRPGRRAARDRTGIVPIRAVLFDAGATLLHPDPPVEEVYARELAVDGARFSAEDLASALGDAWEQVHREGSSDRYGGVTGEPAFWRAFLGRVRGRLDGGLVSDAAFARLSAHFRDPGAWAVYEDVVPTLDRLAESGIPLAIVSNWDSHLPDLLAALGLARRFRAVVVSAIERTGKPDPEIFRRACARLAAEPAQTLHVGDSPRDDYGGARRAGLHALLLDRSGRHPEAADRIRSLSEVHGRIEAWAAESAILPPA